MPEHLIGRNLYFVLIILFLVSTGTGVLRISQSLIKRSLASLYASQLPGCKKDLQVDKDISLKVERVVCSQRFLGKLRRNTPGEGINNAYEIFHQSNISTLYKYLK